MAERNLKGDVNVEFTEATSRQGIDSGESVKTLFGKIRKWLSDLKAVAFSGSYNDLSNKPTIPTKVSQLTNDSGYTTNTGTVKQVTAGAGLSGGNITESGTISLANHSADYIQGGYLNIHPEAAPTLIPFMHNDIAYLIKRGGSAIVKYDNTTQTVDLTNCFDASPSYWIINPTGITTITIELTLHKTFSWANSIYIDFGNLNWRAKSIKIEVINTNYTSDVWTQKYFNTNHSSGYCYISVSHVPVGASNAGSGFNKIRFTFSSWATSTIFRIAQIGVYNYGSYGLRETFLPKDGGNVYGTIYPHNNNVYDLGGTSHYWKNGYFTNINGVAVGSSPKFTDTNTTYSAGIGTTITGTNNAINVSYGTTANTACQGNDSRLSDARPASDVSSWAKASTKPTYTASEVGAATAAQGTKADSAVQTIQMNGNTVTTTNGVVNLGTVITAHQDISGKADKSATVSTITYDTTNKKLTKTINGNTTDVVTTAKLKTDMALSKSDVGLGNVGNFKAVSTVASQGLTDTEKANARNNIGAGTSSFDGDYNSLNNKPTIPAAVAVKGNAETAYRTGNVNLTAANIGAVNKNGDTMTGLLIFKNSNIDRDGTVSSTTAGNVYLTIRDKDNETVATFAAQQAADGTIRCNINAINEKEDGTPVNNYFQVAVGRDGTHSYNMSSPSAFRTAIGLNNVNNTSDLDKPISTATQAALDAISGELDCLTIQAALVNNEVVIQNTSDFTSELYSKYFSYTKPKFAIFKLQITSNTYYYKALINSSSVSQGNLMEASFMTLATGEYIYNFTWLRTFTVGTPTVTRKALNLGS